MSTVATNNLSELMTNKFFFCRFFNCKKKSENSAMSSAYTTFYYRNGFKLFPVGIFFITVITFLTYLALKNLLLITIR